MPRSIDALRPAAHLQLAAQSAAAAAHRAAMAEDRDRPFGEQPFGGRSGRSGGPRAIGDVLVQRFLQRPLEESVGSEAEPPRELAFRRPAPTGVSATSPAQSLVVS